MIRINLSARDFLRLFDWARPVVWFLAVGLLVGLVDAIFGTNLYPIVALAAVALGLLWVASNCEIEIVSRIRDSDLGTTLFGKRDSRILRTLKWRSSKGKYTLVAYLLISPDRGDAEDRFNVHIDLSRHEEHDDCDEFDFVVSDAHHVVLHRSRIVIDRCGDAKISFPLLGREHKVRLNVLGRTQTFRLRVESTNRPEPPEETTNPYKALAAGLLSQRPCSKEEVTRLRRRIALAIHPDRGMPDERDQRTEALAWANVEIDKLEAEFS